MVIIISRIGRLERKVLDLWYPENRGKETLCCFESCRPGGSGKQG